MQSFSEFTGSVEFWEFQVGIHFIRQTEKYSQMFPSRCLPFWTWLTLGYRLVILRRLRSLWFMSWNMHVRTMPWGLFWYYLLNHPASDTVLFVGLIAPYRSLGFGNVMGTTLLLLYGSHPPLVSSSIWDLDDNSFIHKNRNLSRSNFEVNCARHLNGLELAPQHGNLDEKLFIRV